MLAILFKTFWSYNAFKVETEQVGNIQTNYLLMNSEYTISAKTNACNLI